VLFISLSGNSSQGGKLQKFCGK